MILRPIRSAVAVSIVVVILLGGLSVLLASWEARNVAEEAEECRRAFLFLKVGNSSFEDLQRLRAKFQRNVSIRTAKCSADECEIDITFQNASLHRVWLAPWTRFGVSVRVEKGRVVSRAAAQEMLIGDIMFSASTHEMAERPGPYRVSHRRTSTGLAGKLMISLGPGVDEAVLDPAYSFNLACLTRIGGCKDAEDLLPAGWRIASRIPPSTE